MKEKFLSSRRVSPFPAWGDFHARSRFARSTMQRVKRGSVVTSCQNAACSNEFFL